MSISRVELDGVTKRFGATMALRGATATFDGGALSLLVGANGSGKTTLLGVLGTTIRATAGSVRHHPYAELDESVRREIGWLSHETLAYADLSGRQNLELTAELYGLDPAAAWRDVQARFDLGAFANRPLRTNSRGQKQRVALARALIHRPSLLLLDEPTTGLDSSAIALLLEVVREEIAKGVIVIVVAHDPHAFKALDPVVWNVERGRIERLDVSRETDA